MFSSTRPSRAATRLHLSTLEPRLVPAGASVAGTAETALNRRLVADFDGDGKADIAIFQADKDVVVGLSTGEKLTKPKLWADGLGDGHIVRAFAADFDGDGLADVAAMNRKGEWTVGLSDGLSLVVSEWGDFPRVVPTSIRVGDFDGDGRTDLAALTRKGEVVVGVSDGGSFLASEWADGLTGKWKTLDAADVDGDGTTDLVGLRDKTWTAAVSDGSSFATSAYGTWNAKVRASRILVADFDGDGQADVAGVTRKRELLVGINDGDSFATTSAGTLLGKPSKYFTADVDGDGRSEIVSRRNAVIRLITLEGAGIASDELLGWSPIPGNGPGSAADFDGDGRDDLATRNKYGAWFVMAMPETVEVPVTELWHYPYAGEIRPYIDSAPWNPDFPRKWVRVTSGWLHSRMNHNDEAAFDAYVDQFHGVLRGWRSEATVRGLTTQAAFWDFLRPKLAEKFEQVRPALAAKYPGLTDNQYRVLMAMNLVHGHSRFGPGDKFDSSYELLGVSEGNCAHIARSVQDLIEIQGMESRHIALLESFKTPYGPFSTGHNLVIAEGMIVDGEINVAFDVGSLSQLFQIDGPDRLPKLFTDGKVYGFYNWLNSPPIRQDQINRGEDGGVIAYYYWFYLWGLDAGSTRYFTVPPKRD